jgi:hypothetical protein
MGNSNRGDYMNETVPVLKAEAVYRRERLVQLKVRCEYCKTYHFHSIEEGHKVAHCSNENSPYNRTGYEVVLGDDQRE